MGTTLTGTTPQDTYDSLIKVTDNGPLSGTLKALSDGLGNDSALALSTGAASITGTLAVSGNSTFDTTTLVVDAAGDRVILGAAAALQGDTIEIHAKSNSGAISIFGRASDNGSAVSFRSNGATTQKAQIYGSDSGLGFATGTTQRVLIDTSGNVGIGRTPFSAGGFTALDIDGSNGSLFLLRTSGTTNLSIGTSSGNPTIKAEAGKSLNFYTDATQVANITPNGITFGADTAAANALDDYEEGTWTMGISFGGASVGVTYSSNTGTYTKIGRQVTLNGYLQLTSKGSSTGVALITGLPFTIPNTTGNYSAPSLWCRNITFANQYTGIGEVNTNAIALVEITEAGAETSLTDADFANNSAVILSFTYFV